MDGTVTVVGGGLAGLTAALRAARAGVSVRLVTGAGRPGGRARSQERAGAQVNLGAHALALLGPGTAVLRDLGIELPGRSPQVHRTHLVTDGRTEPLFGRGAAGGGLPVVRGLLALRAALRAGEDGSIGDVLRSHVPEPRTRRAVGAIARLATYADDPARQAADVLAAQLRDGVRVRYLDGGWQALVDRLFAAVRAAGVAIVEGVPVRRVVGDAAGTPWAIELADGRQWSTPAVVLAVGDPAHAAAVVDGPASTTLADWAERATASHLACLDVVLSRRPEGPPLALGGDRADFVTVQSDRSELGGIVVHAARFLPLGTRAQGDVREELEATLETVLPGWRRVVRDARFAPGLLLSHDGGSIASGGRRGRPGPSVPGAPGLSLAGDAVGTVGHLAQASLASADLAARQAVAHATRARARMPTSGGAR